MIYDTFGVVNSMKINENLSKSMKIQLIYDI